MGNAERRAIPKRIHWAVDSMDLRPGQQVLEIGFGNGMAISLVHKLIAPDGHIHGIEQSEVQVERGSSRNSWAHKHGMLTLEHAPLATAELRPDRYDVVFATNLNIFWTGDVSAELAMIKASLRPGGTFYLFYEEPAPAKTEQVAAKVTSALETAGFTVEVIPSPTPTQWGVRAAG
ncbi:MAG: Methyltransferase type 12 [Thermoleophilia bacterium]|nr:Methyltransferase type 12 [Thermoleophilia bacterium]